MAMNIYFAGSICGGRQNRELYYKIIEHLKQYGKVLTENIADRDLTEKGEDNTDDRAIHDRDLAWLQSSDLVIAEVTTPSLGVGYEVARAVQFSKRGSLSVSSVGERKAVRYDSGEP